MIWADQLSCDLLSSGQLASYLLNQEQVFLGTEWEWKRCHSPYYNSVCHQEYFETVILGEIVA